MADLIIEALSEAARDSLRQGILNLKAQTHEYHPWLRKGDELCRGRITPMSSQLTNKVIEISKAIRSNKGDTALMLALEKGLMDMVWGFIECAKQTNTNLQTGETGEECVQAFLWVSNERKQTAFDIAIEKNRLDVARQLVNDAPRWCLQSQWIRRREAMLQIINHDSKFDGFVFDMLAGEKERAVRSTSTVVQMYSDRPDDLKIQNKGVDRSVPPEFIDNLGNGLFGSNARKNTVLHLVSKIGNVACIEYILKKDHSLINCHNSDTETPAYVAAREGRVDILRFMINTLKEKNEDIESLLTRSIDQHNALHIAIQNHHVEVIFLLIEEIPQLANCINESRESPLYLAAERGYDGVVQQMLNKCSEIAFEGPIGRTALHAAAISDSAVCLKYLLHKSGNLINVKDDRGWTPLHLAVYHNSSIATKKLLKEDYSIGYHELVLKDGKNTSAIHIAASRGHCETMEVLMELCPGCSEFIDNEGRNILHVAIENRKHKTVEFLFQDKSSTHLINQKDKNGNTPIHLLVSSDFEKMEMLMDSRVNINTLNNEKRTPLDMISDDQRERLIKAMTINASRVHGETSDLSPKINKSDQAKTELEAKRKKTQLNEKETDTNFDIVDNLVIVAALIATASFAAGFTVPGGFDSSDGSKQGTPFLLRKPAFQTFIVTNAIAFCFSCSVLFGHIALLFYRNRYDDASLGEQEYIDKKIESMYYLTTIALFAMTIAFVTGVYVVLTPSLGLAISVCVMVISLMSIIIHQDRFGKSWKPV